MIILDTVGDTIQAEASAVSSITITCYGIETVSAVDTYKKLGQTQLTGSGTQDTIYTVPASTSTVCSVIIIANTASAVRTFKLWHVPNGNSPGDSNVLFENINMAANSTIVWNKGTIQEMPTSDTLSGNEVVSNPGSGEYRIKGLRLSAAGEIVVTYDGDAEP